MNEDKFEKNKGILDRVGGKEKKEIKADDDIEKLKRSYTLPKSVVRKIEELNLSTDKYNRSELVAMAVKEFYEKYND